MISFIKLANRMYYFFTLNFVLLFIIHCSTSEQNPLDQLNHFEIIDPLSPTRTRRDTLGVKNVDFKALGRSFHLYLTLGENVLHKDFQALAVDGKGIKTPIEVLPTESYEGYLSGDPTSSAHVFFEKSGSITATINTENDIIMVEPLSRYRENVINGSMVVYRRSDLKIDPGKNSTICGSKKPPLSFHRAFNDSETGDVPSQSRVRVRREASDTKKNCDILLVADYRFHEKYGNDNPQWTSHYLIELLDRVNHIYRSTEFTDYYGTKFTGFGFTIKNVRIFLSFFYCSANPVMLFPMVAEKILIHTEWSYGTQHYNQIKEDIADVWDTEGLLKAFGRKDYSDYCLAHLFTYQTFSQGILGLAWISSPNLYRNGGICSRSDYNGGEILNLNTAWTCFRDGGGNSLLTLTANLVTAHELGHNWGSNHDPDSRECSPTALEGGKFIMYTYSVSGYETNNRVFSPCSKRNIGAVLSTRSGQCFSVPPPSGGFCGNRRVDPGEQCDSGGRNGDDCCTDKCTLREGAVCSYVNSACCSKQCQLLPTGQICAKRDPTSPCQGNAYCTGRSATCPPPPPINQIECAEYGTCKNGTCRPFCESIVGLLPCVCDAVEDSCKICCRSQRNTSMCQPMDDIKYLDNGRPCLQGFCKDGVCKRSVNKLVERFWHIIDQFQPNMFGVFLWKNLVGSIIIFSLLIWIPVAIVITRYDLKFSTDIFEKMYQPVQTQQI